MSLYIKTRTDLRNHVIDRCGNVAPSDADALTSAVFDLAEARGYDFHAWQDWTPFLESLTDETFFGLDGYMPEAE